MFQSPVKIRDLILFSIFSFVIIFVVFLSSFFDKHTKIVFCNVGQGDAAYIRINNRFDLLIDAGPDRKVLDCLSKYMPFYDRKIELALLSHPNNDHYNGYFFITDRYKIDKFITVNSSIVSKTYKKLLQKISDKKIPLLFSVSGEKIKVKDGQLTFFWPPNNFVSSSDNDFSHIVLFQENNFKALFTGDASPFVLSRLLYQVGAIRESPLHNIDVLKVPHHGSKNGLTESIIKYLRPKIAVISVGKNSYGHPSKLILDLLRKYNVKVRRTDKEGNIDFSISN